MIKVDWWYLRVCYMVLIRVLAYIYYEDVCPFFYHSRSIISKCVHNITNIPSTLVRGDGFNGVHKILHDLKYLAHC